MDEEWVEPGRVRSRGGVVTKQSHRAANQGYVRSEASPHSITEN